VLKIFDFSTVLFSQFP
jgi:hypothetical protein